MEDQIIKSSILPFISYMGAKTTPRATIFSCYPNDMKEIVSPFIGGGSFELYAAASGIKVYANDKYDSLVRLWNIMLTPGMPEKVSERVYELFPINDTQSLTDLVKSGDVHKIEDDIEFASMTICMTKQTFNGYFLGHVYFRDSKYRRFVTKPVDPMKPWIRGPKDERVLNPKYSIKYEKGTLMSPGDWLGWQSPNLSVEQNVWQETLAKYPDKLLYCDPPYMEEKQQRYYGPYRTKKGHPELSKDWLFDHQSFGEGLIKHKGGWALSYLDHPLARELYADYNVIFLSWFQGSLASQMKSDGFSNKELLIMKEPVRHPMAVRYGDLPEEVLRPEAINREELGEQLELF